MTVQMNIQDAKANLSRLVARAQAGDDVVIARAGSPVVRLVPTSPTGQRRFGTIPGKVSDEAMMPLDEEELRAWEM
ncbi:MAG: type II toxin-antitoxin system prevent-host-death family antitoxin [Micrococcales bacterium]|nr:type II toxin-antitoxin system prevent-host-death family antitoxin [Micrococcales bacterium]